MKTGRQISMDSGDIRRTHRIHAGSGGGAYYVFEYFERPAYQKMVEVLKAVNNMLAEWLIQNEGEICPTSNRTID